MYIKKDGFMLLRKGLRTTCLESRDEFKAVFKKNSYFSNFTNFCIKSIVQSVPKRDISITLLFIGSTSFHSGGRFQKLLKKKLNSQNLKIVFNSPIRDENIFKFNDKSGANLGFFHTLSDMRMAQWITVGQTFGPTLVTRLLVTYRLTSIMLQICLLRWYVS